MFFRDSERRSKGMWRYSVRRITDGAFISIRCECSMWPLCSSMRATPLKIMTTARRSVHTLIGSKEAFKTNTRAFMMLVILREPAGKCQNCGDGALAQSAAFLCGISVILCVSVVNKPLERFTTETQRALRKHRDFLPKSISRLNQGAQIPRLHD